VSRAFFVKLTQSKFGLARDSPGIDKILSFKAELLIRWIRSPGKPIKCRFDQRCRMWVVIEGATSYK